MMEVISNCNYSNINVVNKNCNKNNAPEITKRTVRSIKRKKVKQVKDSHCTNCSNDSIANSTISGNSAHEQFNHIQRMWNQSGWIRVYCGPYRDVIDYEEPSRMVNVFQNATTMDVIRDMDLPIEYTLWVSVVWACAYFHLIYCNIKISFHI